ncbi:NmrA/HSCARG family protein [Streptomyces purpureus]|uniref:NmrA/HSCARG family protein n=1 Tax=Streptomyces purpureus TaxID=1951 RepID=UPI000367E272|nr:NmrA/HSCARG family protein [Streptomyces purpureus]
MPEKKIITVFGATGAQGGGLARAILDDGEFAVRAVTRHPESDAARELARLGVELVQADSDDESTLAPALEGSYGAFLMTNFWEHMSGDREKVQAAAMAQACAHVGVQHAIWSTLEDTRECIPLDDPRMPVLQSRYKVPHFDAKAEADAFFTEGGVPTTCLRLTFFWENLLRMSAPQRAEDGTYRISYPMGDKRLSGIAVDDVGRTALGIFKRGTDLIGGTVSIAGEHLTLTEMAGALSESTGLPVVYQPLEPDAFRAQGFPGAEEAGNMFQFYRDCEARFIGARDLDAVRALNPSLQSFETWLAGHQDKLRTAWV